MSQKKTGNSRQQRKMRSAQVIMGVIAIIVILSMVVSMIRF
jgi:predicted nucleic acid-binding Zn ribbon protein